jgi:curved DNA-binding protein CbpA
MSAPVAGNFQDHYSILGVDAQADADAIGLAYAKLADKYHPGNFETGDQDKFDKIVQAYEVLSDPAQRREFDNIKGVSLEVGSPKFSGLPFFEELGRGTGLRLALLCVMYDRRRTRPFTPSLSMRHIENILHATVEELNFALWYLKQRGLANSDDKSSLQITVEGMDFLERVQPKPEVVMPFVKASGLAAPVAGDAAASDASAMADPMIDSLLELGAELGAEAALEPPMESPVEPMVPTLAEAPHREKESVQNVLRRARART